MYFIQPDQHTETHLNNRVSRNKFRVWLSSVEGRVYFRFESVENGLQEEDVNVAFLVQEKYGLDNYLALEGFHSDYVCLKLSLQ